MSVRPTGPPFSRVRSPHSQSEGPDLIPVGQIDNLIILAHKPGYRSSFEDDRLIDGVDCSVSPMRQSTVRSTPNVESVLTEVVLKAQAKTFFQVKANERPSVPGTSARRTSPREAEKGKARAVDSNKEPLTDKQD